MSLPSHPVRSSQYFSIYDISYQPLRCMGKHADVNSRISIIIRGKVKEDAVGKEEFAQSGSLVFKPGDLIHKNTFGSTGTRILSVVFEDGFFDKKEDVKINDWQWFHGALTASAAFEFARNLKYVCNEEDLYEELVELFVKLPASFVVIPNQTPIWLKLIKEKIRDEYNSPIRTKDLAAYSGVHPVYLARAFRRYYGYSVKSFLQNVRLEKALQELGDGKKPLSQIALDAGFSDQSHLNRVFRAKMGMSPGGFRKWSFQ